MLITPQTQTEIINKLEGLEDHIKKSSPFTLIPIFKEKIGENLYTISVKNSLSEPFVVLIFEPYGFEPNPQKLVSTVDYRTTELDEAIKYLNSQYKEIQQQEA